VKFVRFVHRLDAETTGIVLLGKSMGAVRAYSDLFESRKMEKIYYAVVQGVPNEQEWTCRVKLAPDPHRRGRMKADSRHGKSAETRFRVLRSGSATALIEARPFTGRTHQIRIHLTESGFPVVGDDLYGSPKAGSGRNLGLRAVGLAYTDPFRRKRVQIRAPVEEFCREYGFNW